MTADDRDLARILAASPLLAPLLTEWNRVALTDAWLVAGCLAQTVWNHLFHLQASHGIDDIDLVYQDPTDLSAEAERAHERRLRDAFPDLPCRFDVKNQARVYLWYEARFGRPIAPYRSSRHAISTYPTTATALGVRPDGPGLEVHAPFGLDDLLGGVVRANRTLISEDVYDAKVARWTAIWPDLRILPWEAGVFPE